MARFPQVGDEFADYRVVQELGRGGMGVVFEAIQMKLSDRRVALKVLGMQFAADPQYRKRFEREASSLARLNSPHVIHIYEYGEFDGCLFITTQLVSGDNLRTWLDRHGPFELKTALHLVEQISSAVTDAHAVDVIHRDIKPSNVLLRRDGEDALFAYLSDFGIVAIAGADNTRTASVLGTYGYVAPERHLGERASRASDIYSLGCLLWCAATGVAPYGEDGVQAAIKHMHDPIPQLGGTGPAVEAANAILQMAMAKDPAQRYTSTAAMRAHLVEAAQASYVVSVDPGAPERSGESNDTRHEAEPDRTHHDLETAPPVGVRTLDDDGLIQSEDPRANRRKRHRRYVLAAMVLLVLAAGGAALLRSLDSRSPEEAATGSNPTSDQTPPSSSSTGAQVPAPFETQSLYAFTRGSSPPISARFPLPGERPFLEQNPDIERIYCEGDEYAGIFFRKQTLAGLREERPFYLGEAQPGTVRAIPAVSSEEGLLDGPGSVYLHDDGTARVYWQSNSCLCAGVIQAPDDDTVAALQFWEGG